MKKRFFILTLLLTLLIILIGCDNGSVSDSSVPKSSSLVKVCLTVEGDSSELQKSEAVNGSYWTSLTYQYNAVPQWSDPQDKNIHGSADWTTINYFEGISLGYFAPGQWVFGVRVLNGSTVVYEGFSNVIQVKNSSVNVDVFVNKLVTAAVARSVRVSVTAPTVQGEKLSITYSGGTISTDDPEGAISTSSLNGITTFEYIFNNINSDSFVLKYSINGGETIDSDSLAVSLDNNKMAVISGHIDNGIWQLEQNTVKVHKITVVRTHEYGNVYVAGNIGSAAVGDMVTLYIKADDNASFEDDLTVTCDSAPYAEVDWTNIPLSLWYSFIMPDDDVTVTVDFELKADTKINMSYFKIILKAIYDRASYDYSYLNFVHSDTAPNGVESLGIDGVTVWCEEDEEHNNTGNIFWHSAVNNNKLIFRDNDKNMSDFFKDCDKYINISMEGIKTTNITNMSGMFENCLRLETVDLDGVVTSNVDNMANMFHRAGFNNFPSHDTGVAAENKTDNLKDLTILNMNFDTHSVTDMSQMFSTCTITDLSGTNIDEWDTSSVQTFKRMFAGYSIKSGSNYVYWYSKIAELDIAGKKVTAFNRTYNSWNTSSCENFASMFDYCNRLGSFSMYRKVGDDVYEWDFSSATDINRMFDRCESIDYITFPTHTVLNNVTDMCWIFANCNGLDADDFESILARWDIDACHNNQKIDFRKYPSGTPGANDENPNRIYKGTSNILSGATRYFCTYNHDTPNIEFGGSTGGNDAQRLVWYNPDE